MAILRLGNSNSEFSGSFSGSYAGNGSGLTAVSALSASYASTASYVTIESLPLVNPIVEYAIASPVTSSGDTVSMPGTLTFVSSSTYEYLEIFINGLRLRYDIDFAPASTASVKYFLTIPSGSEVTYKSLKRP